MPVLRGSEGLPVAFAKEWLGVVPVNTDTALTSKGIRRVIVEPNLSDHGQGRNAGYSP